MEQALQGFQPDRLMNLIWTVTLGWLIWPFVCGFMGMSRGLAAKGFIHGLLWGPFGVLFILISKQKHECPTCGCKTLSPAKRDELAMLREAGALGAVPMALPPKTVATPVTSAITAETRDAPPAPAVVKVPPAPAIAATRPPTASEGAALPPASIFEQACAGYSEEESARLLAWLNKQAVSMRPAEAK